LKKISDHRDPKLSCLFWLPLARNAGRSNFAVMGKAHQPTAAEFIGLGGHHPDPQILRERMRERDQREAGDTRSPAEKWLGDPPPDRSALAQAKRPATLEDVTGHCGKPRLRSVKPAD
jgi:hypothetical protein